MEFDSEVDVTRDFTKDGTLIAADLKAYSRAKAKRQSWMQSTMR